MQIESEEDIKLQEEFNKVFYDYIIKLMKEYPVFI